jgi:hypothetical protein
MMKNINKNNLDILVSKILSETLEQKADKIVSELKGSVCEQCGAKMNENICEQCGTKMNEGIYDVDDLDDTNEFDYVEEEIDEATDEFGNKLDLSTKESDCKRFMINFGEDDPETKKRCQGVNLNESLKGGQRRLDKNKNNKIDAEDFKMLRQGKKSETDEGIGEYENIGADDFHERTGYQYWDYQKKDDSNSPEDKKDKKNIEFEDKYPFKEKKPSFFDRFLKKIKMDEEETQEGNAFTGALAKARKQNKDEFEVGGKKFETKEEDEKFIQKAVDKMEKKGSEGSFKRYCGGEVTKSCIDKALKSGSTSLVKKANFAKNIKAYDGAKHKKKIKESYKLTESELVSMIEKIVLEQKEKSKKENNIKGIGGSPRGLEVYKKAHKGSGKENEDYIKDVTKKMKDYLKDGSKGEYDMNPKTFPVGNGELGKMDKKAFQMTDDLEDFNYEIAGQNFPVPDAIEYNEEWMEKLYKGDSMTGNAPGGNALASKTNDRFDKMRKKNTLKKLKDQSYKRVPQPVFNEKTGTEKGKGVNVKLESTENKKLKLINEEFERMKSLISYNQKTQ